MDSIAVDRWQILQSREAWAVQALADIQQRVELDTWGHHDLWAPAPVWQAILDDRADAEHRLFVAIPGGITDPSTQDVAGVGLVTLPVAGHDQPASFTLLVPPDRRRAGVGGALYRHLEREAASAGRTTLVTYAAVGPEPAPGPDVLEPPSGSGRVAADAASARFALAHGYALAQIVRLSTLTVPADLDGIAARRDAALGAAGPDYRLCSWHDEVPAARLGQVAGLLARMGVDAPHDGMPCDTQPWDAARAGRWVESFANRGLHVGITVAEHLPTGAQAGHTVLMYPMADVAFAFQQDTLVLTEHRGHRLGTALKTANLLAVRERRPGLRRVHTDNAQENAPMLAINVALGFVTAGVSAGWRKQLR